MDTNADKLAFKHRLKFYCESIIGTRIDAAKKAIDDAQSAANAEEKSSAGDKYETSRAMSHLQKDMHSRQLIAHMEELNTLRSIDVQQLCPSAARGAVVQCAEVTFFIATGIGKQLIDGMTVIFISPESPLAGRMKGKKAGDTIFFNGELEISDVY